MAISVVTAWVRTAADSHKDGLSLFLIAGNWELSPHAIFLSAANLSVISEKRHG